MPNAYQVMRVRRSSITCVSGQPTSLLSSSLAACYSDLLHNFSQKTSPCGAVHCRLTEPSRDTDRAKLAQACRRRLESR